MRKLSVSSTSCGRKCWWTCFRIENCRNKILAIKNVKPLNGIQYCVIYAYIGKFKKIYKTTKVHIVIWFKYVQ